MLIVKNNLLEIKPKIEKKPETASFNRENVLPFVIKKFNKNL